MKIKLLENQLNKATSELVSLNEKYQMAQKEIGELKIKNTELETKNAELTKRIEAIEVSKGML